MNILMSEIKRSLNSPDMGLSGELKIREAMDSLMLALYVNEVPQTYVKFADFSIRPLISWWKNLLDRHQAIKFMECRSSPSKISLGSRFI
jgi:hypothetical protein